MSRTHPRRGPSAQGGTELRGGGAVLGDAAPPPPPPDDPRAQQPPGDPESVARTICLRLLDQRARSRSELEQALRRRGVPDKAATAVLDRFAEVGLIDDTALAHTMAVAQHRERGLARRAVAAKLRSRGLDDEVIGSALTEIEPEDERTRARELVQRRSRSLAGLPLEVRTRRLVGLLGRKGYPAGLAYDVVRDVLRGADSEWNERLGNEDFPVD